MAWEYIIIYYHVYLRNQLIFGVYRWEYVSRGGEHQYNIDENVQIIMTDLANDVSAWDFTFSVASDRAIAPTMALP
jgi:hypothetical protein